MLSQQNKNSAYHNAGKLENSKHLHCDAMQTAKLF